MKRKFGTHTHLAGVGKRSVAIFMDTLVLGLISLMIFGTVGDIGWGVNFLLTVGYNWFFWTRQDGQTPGKRLVGIRIIKMDGTPIRDIDALIRVVGYYVSGMVFGIGYLWALFDKRKRTWHDIFAGTLVIVD